MYKANGQEGHLNPASGPGEGGYGFASSFLAVNSAGHSEERPELEGVCFGSPWKTIVVACLCEESRLFEAWAQNIVWEKNAAVTYQNLSSACNKAICFFKFNLVYFDQSFNLQCVSN